MTDRLFIRGDEIRRHAEFGACEEAAADHGIDTSEFVANWKDLLRERDALKKELLAIHKIIHCPGNVKLGQYDDAPWTVKAVADYILVMHMLDSSFGYAGEKEAVKAAVAAGSRYGYGNMIGRLRRAWLLELYKTGMTWRGAAQGALMSKSEVELIVHAAEEDEKSLMKGLLDYTGQV